VKKVPCVYIPFEGKGGIPRRVAAWRQGHAGLSTEIRFITDKIDLRNSEDRDRLVETLVAEGLTDGVYGIDTLAAAGGSFDENSSKDMGEMISIIHDLQRRVRGVVLPVHHSGKEVSRGMRGHSSLHAALDFAVECYRSDGDDKFEAYFKLAKVKDDEDGLEFDFCMTRQMLDQDEDGDWRTSLSLNPQQRVPASDAEAEAVLAVIQRGPISQRELIATLLHIPRDRVKSAVKRLAKEEKVLGHGDRGKTAKLRLMRGPYRACALAH
jgi:hypothetical protein